VIVVEMGIEQITHGLIGPLPDLCDVFAREGWLVTGVHDKNLPLPNDHRRISVDVAVSRTLVLDGVHAIREPGDFPFIGIAEYWAGRYQHD
jgi:hypothetical protein